MKEDPDNQNNQGDEETPSLSGKGGDAKLQPYEKLFKQLQAGDPVEDIRKGFRDLAPKALRDTVAGIDVKKLLAPTMLPQVEELFSGFEDGDDDDSILEKVKKLIAPILEFIGYSDLPKMEDMSDLTTPHIEQTETQATIDGVQKNTANQSSATINNPSVENQGVIKDQSKATSPKVASQTDVENMMITLSEPPANRTQIA